MPLRTERRASRLRKLATRLHTEVSMELQCPRGVVLPKEPSSHGTSPWPARFRHVSAQNRALSASHQTAFAVGAIPAAALARST